MKKFLSGLVLGMLLLPAYNDGYDIYEHFSKSEIPFKYFSFGVRPSLGIANVVTGDCTRDISKNGHGWVFVNREYFSCNKVEIFISDLIYGEYTRPVDPELEKKVCKNCTF